MAKKIRCKTCGTYFEPKTAGDKFCSAVCRTTGLFVSGGGDTSKPLSYEQKKALEKKGVSNKTSSTKKEVPKKLTNAAAKFPRVLKLFNLPQEERWDLAKTFSPEEAEYARRLARKALADERKIEELIEWDATSDMAEESASYKGITGGSLGDSDDGSI